jgi:hypothetical protein
VKEIGFANDMYSRFKSNPNSYQLKYSVSYPPTAVDATISVRTQNAVEYPAKPVLSITLGAGEYT